MSVQEELDQYDADMEYFDSHRSKLLTCHPDCWVAVYKQEVVGTAPEMRGLVKELEAKGIPPGFAYCEFLSTEPILLALASHLP
ncbi:MAG: hypothetical protein ACR2PL_08460 [Dehalococcoidia bacterium]